MATTEPKMLCLIINMDSAQDRLGFMAAQMADLGLSWERVPAVTPDSLVPPKTDPVWHRWQRPLRVTEMALCASHMEAWRKIVAQGTPCVVLEDDALLAADLVGFLSQVADLAGIDHISLETRSRRKMLARKAHPQAPIRRLYQDRTGSAAMVIWPSGAKKLLAAAERAGAPSDALISSCPGLRSYQADPALSIQLDQSEAYGVPQAIPTKSLIDAAKKPARGGVPLGARLGYRRRRIGAQIMMGLKMLLRAPVAERVHVVPADRWARPTPAQTDAQP